MTRHTIGKYKLFYFAKRSSESKKIGHIALYDTQDQYVGYIEFYRDGQSVPDNSESDNYTPTRVFLRTNENQIPRIVDMLRNEKPCTVYYSSPNYAYVHTGNEPVGEEETEE